MSDANVEERLRSDLLEDFLKVAVGQSRLAAYSYLNASDWQLDDALQLYFDVNGDDDSDSAAVSPPLSPGREVLHHASTSGTTSDRPTRAYLFKPPPGMVFRGSFFMAMETAAMQGRWLLVNVQFEEEFDSHLLNRDTWSDKTLVEVITSQFLFWQVEREQGEGAKVANFYRLSSFPAVMVVDPVTGEKKWGRQRMIDAASLLCDLMPFTESGPCEEYKHLNIVCPEHEAEEEASTSDHDQYNHHHPTHETATTSAATGWGEELDDEEENIGDCHGLNLNEYPNLPEEPVNQNRDMVCKVAIRLPDGRRVQRTFNKSDPMQLLWSFGHTLLDEEAKNRPFRFRLVEAVPGEPRILEYREQRTFDDEQLNNTMLSLTLND